MFPNYGDNEFIEKTRKFLAVIVDNGIEMGKLQARHEANPNTKDMIKMQERGREIGRMSENLLVNLAYELSHGDLTTRYPLDLPGEAHLIAVSRELFDSIANTQKANCISHTEAEELLDLIMKEKPCIRAYSYIENKED